MRKFLKPGDVLLLGLAGALDVFEEIKDPFGIMASGSRALYGWVPPRYRRHNFSRVVGRQLKTGDIEKVIKGDETYFRLTSEGRERITRDFPLLHLANKPWDKRWRLVIFDIDELNKNTRNVLRGKLRQLGLGMLQKSVWITPHDVSVDLREFLESKGLGEEVFVLEVSDILAGNRALLVRKIWALDALEEAYQDIIKDATELFDMYVVRSGRISQYTRREKAESMGKKITEEKTIEKEITEEVRKIRERYGEALLSDPCLPKELLPNEWPAADARRAVRDLQKIIIR